MFFHNKSSFVFSLPNPLPIYIKRYSQPVLLRNKRPRLQHSVLTNHPAYRPVGLPDPVRLSLAGPERHRRSFPRVDADEVGLHFTFSQILSSLLRISFIHALAFDLAAFDLVAFVSHFETILSIVSLSRRKQTAATLDIADVRNA